jgi:HK97 family phage portal protein
MVKAMFLKRLINWVASWGGALGTASGQQLGQPTEPIFGELRPIQSDQMLQISAVYSCVELLSNTMATLPIFVYKKDPKGGRVPDRSSNLFTLLHDQPNAWMTPSEFVAVMVVNRILKGNAYAYVQRDAAGNPVALIPLPADQVEVDVIDGGEVFLYHQDGHIDAYDGANVIHWKGIGNGYIGLSKLDFMRASGNEAINAQLAANKLFANGGKPSGILATDSTLSEEQVKTVFSRFKGMSSSGNGLYVVDRGLKYEALSLSPQETQLLETRKYGVEEICRWFGVPAVLVGASGATTWGSGIAEIVQGFHKFTLAPLCTQFQQALMRRLVPLHMRDKVSIEMKFDALLRSAPGERAEFYAKMAQNGMMTRNEVRNLENLCSCEGGDELTAQSNLVPLQNLGQQSQTGSSPQDGTPIRQ